jgi:ABC-2 type transport system permease protein
MGGSFSDDAGADRASQVLVVNEDRGTQAAAILGRLAESGVLAVETTWGGQPLTRQRAERLVVGRKRSLALVFPPDFSRALEQGEQRTTEVVAFVDPSPSVQSVDPILTRLQGAVERAALMARLGESEFRSAVTVRRMTPMGMEGAKLPDAFQQNVPGITIYGIFWIVSMLAGSVYQEKREGTFRRLLVAPMRRSVMLAGKVLPYYLINLLQVVAMLGLSSLLFGMSLGNSPAGLVAVSLAAAATATGLGVLVAALGRTEAQVGTLATILLLVLSVLGGCFIPRWVMPPWLQTLGLLTPHAWAVDAYQALMVQGRGLLAVLPQVGALAAFAVLFFGLGVWRFRFE